MGTARRVRGSLRPAIGRIAADRFLLVACYSSKRIQDVPTSHAYSSFDTLLRTQWDV